MATTTTYSPSSSFRPLAGIASFANKVLNATIESRTAAAQRFVKAHMNSMSDKQLAEYGFDSADIARIRNGENISAIL